MSMERTAEMLLDACTRAGVDAELIFNHYDRRDIEAYAEAIADGSVRRDELHRWMESTAATILDGRCLCRRCKAGRRT